MKNEDIENITMVALFMALVLIASKIEIRISDVRFHLGNVMCLLSAFILRPVDAGLASGFGSMLFDVLFYTSGLSCIITLITKFVMGFMASFCFNRINKMSESIISIIVSGIVGEIFYIILYALKTYIERRYFLSMSVSVVIPIMWAKITASLINAAIAVVISTFLYSFIKKMRINKGKQA